MIKYWVPNALTNVNKLNLFGNVMDFLVACNKAK